MGLADYILGSLGLIAGLLALLLIAGGLARRLIPGWQGPPLWVAMTVIAASAAIVAAQLLGTLGLLNGWSLLVPLVAILAGLFAGSERGPTVGFVAGLLWDVYLPTPLGVAAIVFALIAYVVAVLASGLFHDSRVQLFAVAFFATVGAVIGYALLAEVVGARGLVDLELADARDAALAHAAGDDGSVTGHAAARGHDALRSHHAVEVVGAGLVAHEDHGFAGAGPGNRVVRIEHDATDCGAG